MTAPAPETAVVTGATGALGRALAARLGGASPLVAVARAAPRDPVAGGSRLVLGDVCEVEWAPLLGRGTTAFHLAAYVHARPRGALDVARMEAVNVAATERLARACLDADAKLVFASTVAVYAPGREPGGPRSLAPATDYGRTKLAAEERIRALGERGLRFVILRLPLLYGPHGRGNVERMLRAIARRWYVPIGDPRTRKACLFHADAAAALAAAAAAPEAEGQTFDVSPRTLPTLGEIHAAAFDAFGRKSPPHVPPGVAMGGARLADLALRLVGRAGAARVVEALTAASEQDGARFAAATGFADRVALAEGMHRTVAWLRQERRA